MRKVSANYVYSPDLGFIKYGIIVLNDDAFVEEIIDTKGMIKEIQGLEFYSGLLVSGRIYRHELFNSACKGEVMLEKILDNVLQEKDKIGLTILNDVDYNDFTIRPTTTANILA